jgi:hypothetical protein
LEGPHARGRHQEGRIEPPLRRRDERVGEEREGLCAVRERRGEEREAGAL